MEHVKFETPSKYLSRNMGAGSEVRKFWAGDLNLGVLTIQTLHQ